MRFRSLLALTAPVAMGYVPLSMAFGFLVVQSGLPFWLAPAMSVIVYTGTLQFLAVPMLAAGLSLGEIAFVALATNTRHAFYGLALRHHMPRHPLIRLYAIYSLTDESFSLATAGSQPVAPNDIAWISGINQFWWVAGTILGATLGQSLPDLQGLSFALTALFIVLTIDQARRIRETLPFAVAAAACMLALILAPGNMLFAAVGLTTLAILAAAFRARRFAADGSA